ncbi:MAG: YbhB/YbcL family Raf kinase inhibitor-like protein [Patescibacteria group bacterium]|nr:YbhB/YbcL family Raf kinase inhibitor-like protein [Patescibacteria group bacterium]
MKLVSRDFVEGQMLAPTFTCDGEGLSPHMAWSDAPPETKSFALRCFDPDAPGGGFVHWLVVNISAAAREIPGSGPLPVGCLPILNDSGQTPYCPPCPPSGVHRYQFTVYALDVAMLSNVTAENFLEQMQQHTLASAMLAGRYQRQR